MLVRFGGDAEKKKERLDGPHPNDSGGYRRRYFGAARCHATSTSIATNDADHAGILPVRTKRRAYPRSLTAVAAALRSSVLLGGGPYNGGELSTKVSARLFRWLQGCRRGCPDAPLGRSCRQPDEHPAARGLRQPQEAPMRRTSESLASVKYKTSTETMVNHVRPRLGAAVGRPEAGGQGRRRGLVPAGHQALARRLRRNSDDTHRHRKHRPSSPRKPPPRCQPSTDDPSATRG